MMEDSNKEITSISWVIFIAICLLVILIGYLVEEKFRSLETERAHNTLISIGSLKANELSSWIKEIHDDSKLLMLDEAFNEKIYQYTVFNKVSELPTIHKYLQSMQELHGYLTVEFISADGTINISPSVSYPFSEDNKKNISKVIAKNKIIVTDLHKHQTNGEPNVGTDVYIPVRYYNNGEYLIIGAILIRTDANEKIFPLLETWPYKSASAETLLVKREGEQVVFLTDLRFTRDAAFELTHSIDNISLPAAIALRGYEGVMTGLDYRGVEVIATSHKIDGTNMALISKIDSDEVYHYVELITRWAISLTLIILAIVFISFYYWNRLFNERLIAQQYKSQLDKKALESHLELLSKYANDIILLTDNDWKIIEVNERALAAYQYNYEELIGQSYKDLKVGLAEGENEEVFDGSYNDGFIFEDKHKRKDNSIFPVEVSLRTIKKEGILYRQLIIRDITERKNIEHRFKLAVNATAQGIWDWDMISNNIWWSDNTYKLLGYVTNEISPTYDKFIELVHPEDRMYLQRFIKLSIEQIDTTRLDVEIRLKLKSGKYSFFMLRGQIEYDDEGKPIKMIGSLLDLTEKKKYQNMLKEEEVKYAALIENIPECVYSFSANKKSLATKQMFISSEWNEWTGKSVDELLEDSHLWYGAIHDDDKKDSFKCFAVAVKNHAEYYSEYRLVNDKTNVVHYIRDHGIPRAQEESAETVIYDGVMTDITSEKIAQLESEESNELYKNSLIETIKAISITVEKRDPYTAGHQNRVSVLSVLIAKKLKLTEHQIKGLRLGAMIHDIGKIYIPAEILNRPGKLTAAEFDMIKSHPEVGFDIIKSITFPWPVANMILQHHERLDGSGYPNGLKEDEIILEAKILTVADVVEAITAHRPYRASLKLDVAIDEIKKHRGIYYSPDVVDACLEIIESVDFNLEQLAIVKKSA